MVKIDLRRLRPAELARLLNSTPLGEVVQPQVVYRQQNRAGYRIGDGRRIDLVRYTAWLARDRHEPRPKKLLTGYDALKESAAARNRALSQSGRDIGNLPEVVDPERREKASTDFRFFCDAYFPETFHLAWSPDHLKVIARLNEVVLRGGQSTQGKTAGWRRWR